jgi:hypothetical protein
MSSTWQQGYQAMRPAVLAHLRFTFRFMRPEEREDAIQETEALVVVAYERLFMQGRAAVAFASPLARYAVAQYRTGRRVGGQLNVNDVMSRHAQRHHDLVVERLDRRYPDGAWKEVLVEDHRTPVPDQVAFRIDFETWLAGLSRVKRAVTALLARRETTGDTARCCGLTKGRVSQMRRELQENWQAYRGEYA